MKEIVRKKGKNYYTSEYFRQQLINELNTQITDRSARRYLERFKNIEGTARPKLYSAEAINQALVSYKQSLTDRKLKQKNKDFKVGHVLANIIKDEIQLENIQTKKLNAIIDYLLKANNIEFNDKQLEKDQLLLASNQLGSPTDSDIEAIKEAHRRYKNNDYIIKKQD